MMTTQLTIGKDWQQITDGSTDRTIQVYSPVEICRNTAKPPSNSPCLVFEYTTLTITAPDIAWIRSVLDSAFVTIW